MGMGSQGTNVIEQVTRPSLHNLMTFLISPSSLVIVTNFNGKCLSLAFSDHCKWRHVS